MIFQRKKLTGHRYFERSLINAVNAKADAA